MARRRSLVFLDAPGYVQTEVAIQPAPSRATARRPAEAQHIPGCSISTGGGPSLAMDSAGAQRAPDSSGSGGAADAVERETRRRAALGEQSKPGSRDRSAGGAAVGVAEQGVCAFASEHSSRSSAAPDLASADGWAIQRTLLPQAPHRGLALALAYRVAAMGPGAAGCSLAATPAENGSAPLRLAVIGAPFDSVTRGEGGLRCACCIAAWRLRW